MTTTMTKDLTAAKVNWSNGSYRATARSERSYREHDYVLDEFLPNVTVEVQIDGFQPIVFEYAGTDRYGSHSVVPADNKRFLGEIDETAFPTDAAGIETWFDGIGDVALTAFEQYVDAAEATERQELAKIDAIQVPQGVAITEIEGRSQYLIEFSHSSEGVEFEVRKFVEIEGHPSATAHQNQKQAWASWQSMVKGLRKQPETAICATAGLKVLGGSQADAIAEMFEHFVDV